ALIAYLQRLGADLSAPPAAKTETTGAGKDTTTDAAQASTTLPTLTRTVRDFDMNRLLTAAR
ncbi:MAG: hypothetical protein ACPHJ3_16365, partial [Rubripirellula sp.]